MNHQPCIQRLRHLTTSIIVCLISALYPMTARSQVTVTDATDSIQPSISLSDTILLKGVEVTASEITKNGNKLIAYPNPESKARAIDAADLIGTLGLPGIFLDPKSNRLSLLKKGSIAYRINGGKATAEDLLAITPSKIRRIEYILNPGYDYDDAGALIDVYTHRDPVGTSGIFRERHALNRGKGTFTNTLQSNYKKSEFTVYSLFEYARLSDSYTNSSETFLGDATSPLTRVTKENPHIFKEDFNQTFISYSYMDDSNLLLVKANMTNYHTPSTRSSGTVDEYTPESSSTEYRNYRRKSSDNRYSINAYYQRDFKTRSKLYADVMYYYMDESRNSVKDYRYADDQHDEYTITTIGYGKNHSLLSELKYMHPIGNGRVSAGINYDWTKNQNDYSGSTEYTANQTRHDSRLYAQWQSYVKGVDYSIGIEDKIQRWTINREKSQSNRLNATANMSYSPTPSVMLSLNAKMSTYNPSLGRSSDVIIQDDKFNYTSGNPDLKQETAYTVSFSPMYISRIFYGNLDISYTRTNNALMTNVFYNTQQYISTTINGDHSDNIDITFSSRIRLLNNKLSITPRAGYTYQQAACAYYRHSLNSWWIRSSVSYDISRNFEVSADYTKGGNYLIYGLTELRGGQYIGAGITYRLNKMRASLDCNIPLNRFSEERRLLSDINPGITTSYCGRLKPTVSLQVSWSFSTANRKEHNQKSINRGTEDNGML